MYGGYGTAYGYGGYAGGYAAAPCGVGGGFGSAGYALILVLFILLVIIGSSWHCR